MHHHSITVSRWRVAISCAALLPAFTALAQPARQPVSAHVPAAARLARPVARMQDTERLSLAITLPLRNPAALSNLLHEINDPASPNYHHYLTREQFTERFGPTEPDYNEVRRFAIANGFRVNAEHANRMLLEVTGAVPDIERAFHTTLGVYQHPNEARTFYAPNSEPSLDLAVPVLSIGGLDNFALARPRLQSVSAAYAPNAAPNLGSGPNGSYSGGDFRAAYAPNTTMTGAGQIVGLLQFDGYTTSDITYYESHTGLPSVTLSNILLNGASGLPSHNGGEVEVSLDIEAAIAMAPGLAQVMVYEAPNPSPFEIILNRMVSDNVAKQLSCSWFIPGGVANPAADQIFQEMTLQGQTFFNASGDDDAYTGLIDFPGDTPYITQVGGTTLTTTGPLGARVSETVWNRGNGIGSGGGISTQYPIPTWQTNINMAANLGSATMRNTPDVALTGENVYVRANGSDLRVSGTSCSAPLWAGFAALVNQRALASGQPPIGFINQIVDNIGSGPGYASCFFDITTGDNTKSGSPTKFFATTGYDLCTGWGTPAGQSLIDALANSEPLHVTPGVGFTSTGGVGGPFTVTSQNLSLTNAGTNALNWTLINNTPWLSALPTSGTLSTGAAPTTVTVGLNSAASNLLAGTYNGSVYVSNLDSHASFERDYSLLVLNPPSVTTQPTNQSVLDGATATFSAVVTGGLPLFYQWRLNGTNVIDGGDFTGAATATLTISNVSLADTGIYTLFITNAAGATTSSNAVLSITASQPVIIVPPTNQTVVVGNTATFNVKAIGNKPFFYQWIYGGPGGTNIYGATNATLALTNAQSSDVGSYSVAITNGNGSTTSSNAALHVIPLISTIPMIVTFSPISGKVGDTVILAGSNFSAVASNNVVFFGAVRATVTSANTSDVTVVVPSGATLAPITLLVNGLMASTGQPFVPTYPGIGGFNASSLAERADLSTASGPLPTIITDLDLDGKPDIFIGDAAAGKISIFRNISTNGSLSAGSFAPRVDLSMGSFGASDPYSIAAGDVNGDGKIDIVAVNADNKVISIFRNASQPGNIDTNSFDTRIDVSGGNVMRGVVLGDLDGDGKIDIVASDTGDSTVSVFQNQCSGTNISFASRVSFGTAAGAFGVGIADVDRDGKADIISVNNGGGSAGTVSIWKNISTTGLISDTSFMQRIDLPADNSGESLAIADIDGDGKLDLVVGSPSAGGIFIYRNTSTAGVINNNSFAPEVTFGAAGTVNHVALADIDGDGKVDIAVVTQASGVLSVFKNVSTPGNFTTSSLAPRVDFSASVNAGGVALGDLDGDGRPDVVFNNFYDNTMSIYRNVIPIGQLPAITIQPTNLTVSVGGTANFSVGAIGTAPLSYQWQFNGSNNISLATNTILTITNVSLTNAGFYSVTVSNQFGSVTSSNVSLTVTGFDHFGWGSIPSPRFLNSPFAVTIVAQDTANATFTNFTGTVVISATNGVLVSPQLSGNFVAGVWNGAIAVPQTISGLTLKANDAAGHFGFANTIDIVSPPGLSTLNFGTSLLVAWPLSPSGFVLESSSSLSPGTWSIVPGSPIPFNGQNLQSVPLSDTNQFFRLRFSGP